jgi:hypothetical protein
MTYSARQSSVTAKLSIHVDSTGSISKACDGRLCPAILECREVMFSLLPFVPTKYFPKLPEQFGFAEKVPRFFDQSCCIDEALSKQVD